MTTGLVAGMGLARAAEVVAEKAASLLSPGRRRAVWTEVGSLTVLVGIATPDATCAVAINRPEYDGLKLMEILDGCVLDQGPKGGATSGR